MYEFEWHAFFKWLNLFNNADQRNNDLPIVSTNAPDAMDLDAMNEDCLLEIFSVESLDLMDLCSIAETCTRFRQITQRIVPKAIRIVKNSRTRYDIEFGLCGRRTRNDVERIFKNFGSNLHAIEMCELSLFGCDLPKDLNRFAGLNHLKELKICRYQYVNSVIAFDVAGIVSKLTELEKLFISGPRDILDERTFAEIVRIVNGRPNTLTLMCKRNFKVKSGNQTPRVRLMRPY